ncbi:MAG: hypothetical protein H6Q90_7011, partial [Deltaproteobacteria bacterium]|nr:hypothetical protein [Deltaproteobacteria bacterium]
IARSSKNAGLLGSVARIHSGWRRRGSVAGAGSATWPTTGKCTRDSDISGGIPHARRQCEREGAYGVLTIMTQSKCADADRVRTPVWTRLRVSFVVDV